LIVAFVVAVHVVAVDNQMEHMMVGVNIYNMNVAHGMVVGHIPKKMI